MIYLQLPLKRGITADKKRDIIEISELPDWRRCMSQGFGENKLSFYKELGLKGHNGEDIITLKGEEVYAAHEGVVTEVSEDLYAGKGVVIWNEDWLIKTIYWHFLKNTVRVGQEVKVGELIGLADSTGKSTGSHLHFGYKETDKNGITINRNNGYWGAISPEPLWNYMESTNKTPMRGLLVKGHPDPTRIYFVRKGIRYHIASPDILSTLWKWEDVVSISRDKWDRLKEGPPITFANKESIVSIIKNLFS